MRLKVGKIKKEIGGRGFKEIFEAKNKTINFFYNKVKDLGINECEAYELLLKLLEKGVRSAISVEVNFNDSIITIEDWIEK